MAAIRQNGYTFIELVVVVALVGLLSLGLVSIFFASLRGTSYAKAEAAVKFQGDQAITLMERNIRNAVSEPNCGDGSSVSFRLPGESENTVFSFNGNSLLRGEARLIDGDVEVSSATFGCNLAEDGLSFGSVTISMTLRADDKMSQEDVVQTFRTTVAIRSTR